MALTDKTKKLLAAGLFALLVISVVYNLSRDPRSIYKPGESPRDVLQEQRKHRMNPVKENEESLLKINLLDGSAVRYNSEKGRNIFSLLPPQEPVVKPKTTPAAVVAAPVVQEQPVRIEKPYQYVGFAQADNKNYAALLEKNSGKMLIVYDGMNLGNGYIVKSVERKRILLFDSNNKLELELTITE